MELEGIHEDQKNALANIKVVVRRDKEKYANQQEFQIE